jgi:hypothetical protein
MERKEYIIELKNHFSQIYDFPYAKISEDFKGFEFRKDLCSDYDDFKRESIVKIIKNFSRRKGLQTEITKKGELRMEMKDKKYSVSVHLGKEPSDSVSIYFMNSLEPKFSPANFD